VGTNVSWWRFVGLAYSTTNWLRRWLNYKLDNQGCNSSSSDIFLGINSNKTKKLDFPKTDKILAKSVI